jgi:thiamine-monophosphate kinase
MMDISDGLSTDLVRLCEASGVGAVIAEGALPGPEGVPQDESVRLALHGGDDYELLFAVSPGKVRRLKQSYRGVPITFVGTITKKRQLLLMRENAVAEELLPGGWDPFRK